MRTFAASLLLLVVAASANAAVKNLHKRGLAALEGNGHGSAQYLPPVSTSYEAPVYKPQTLSTSFVAPASTYGVPSFNSPVSTYKEASYAVPAATYGVPAVHSQVSVVKPVTTSYVAPAPAYVAPAPVYSAPAPVYSAPTPVYSAPVSHPVSVSSGYSSGLSLGHLSVPSASYSLPSTSYGVPSASYSVPSASYSVPSASYSAPSASYGVPSVASLSAVVDHAPVVPQTGLNLGLSLGHSSVHSGSLGVAEQSAVGAIDLSSGGASLGQDDGYSYPVPSKQLLV
nr:cuticle protein 16.5-like [Megalopta genalis]